MTSSQGSGQAPPGRDRVGALAAFYARVPVGQRYRRFAEREARDRAERQNKARAHAADAEVARGIPVRHVMSATVAKRHRHTAIRWKSLAYASRRSCRVRGR